MGGFQAAIWPDFCGGLVSSQKLQIARPRMFRGMETHMFATNIPGGAVDEQIRELYELYLDLLANTRAEIAARTAPGALRDRLLGDYAPLPFEHFEARLARLKSDPPRYAEAVACLRRGFVACR
jgi:hypothetical protein